MNIENIIALARQLQSLGFENTDYLLLKRICFRPDKFLLTQKFERQKEQLTFQLFFEKDSSQNVYALKYYDALLQKETISEDKIISGIDIANLEKLMIEINWKNAFDFETKKLISLDNKTSWDEEQKIESAIESLTALEKSEDGRGIAATLKLKYWIGIPYQELFGTIYPLKNKSDISQRFYFFEGQAGISVDEANRFLQNRLLEKQMHAIRKQTDTEKVKEAENNSEGSTDNGLLKKKNSGKYKTGKRNASI